MSEMEFAPSCVGRSSGRPTEPCCIVVFGSGSSDWQARSYSAGMSSRRDRSPAAPNTTMQQGSVGLPELSPTQLGANSISLMVSLFFYRMTAELLAQRRDDLDAEALILTRGKPFVQRLRDHRNRNGVFHGIGDAPAPHSG